MSSSAPGPQPSAAPPSSNQPFEQESSNNHNAALSDNGPSPSQPSLPQPSRKPLLRLELRDVSAPGAHAFLRLVHASTALEDSVKAVITLLYQSYSAPSIPPTRSITLVLRSMPGVAYTTGIDIDDDHKEIHLSTDYIAHVPENRQKEEIAGVLVHEMVHCWQWNARGTAPGGLIEGIADWVRLKAGLGPPHWKRHADGNWDSGYERTGYFLEWLERKHGGSIVRAINHALKDVKYKEDNFWDQLTGSSVDELWKEYGEWLGKENEAEGKDGKGEEKGKDEKVVDEETADHEANDAPSKEPEREHTNPISEYEQARLKARRGGNMHIPVRPGFSSG